MVKLSIGSLYLVLSLPVACCNSALNVAYKHLFILQLNFAGTNFSFYPTVQVVINIEEFDICIFSHFIQLFDFIKRK